MFCFYLSFLIKIQICYLCFSFIYSTTGSFMYRCTCINFADTSFAISCQCVVILLLQTGKLKLKNYAQVYETIYVVRASERPQKKSQILRDFQRQICGKSGWIRRKFGEFGANFAEKWLVENSLDIFCWKAIGLALTCWMFLT